MIKSFRFGRVFISYAFQADVHKEREAAGVIRIERAPMSNRFDYGCDRDEDNLQPLSLPKITKYQI